MSNSSEIRFVAEDHSYWIGDTKLESVTTLIKSLSKPFDKDRVSLYCAKKEGVTQAEILEQWEKKGEASRERGTMVHSYIETAIDGVIDPVLAEMNVKIPEMFAFDKAWAAFKERLFAKVERKEFVVGDASLGVAGRIDILLSVNAGGNLVNSIFDWKTGKLEKDNRFQNLLPPFSDLNDCELVKYSLQLSLYRLLMEKSHGTLLGDSYLVHLKSDGTFFIHRAIDYRDRLSEWLTRRQNAQQ